MTSTEYLRVFARFWWVIVLCVVAGGAAHLVVNRVSEPGYTSPASVLISATTGTAGTAVSASEAYTGTLLAQERMPSYANLARGTTFASEIAQELELDVSPDELARHITVVVPTDTTVLSIRVVESDPSVAERVSTAAATRLAQTVNKLEQVRGQGRPLLRATIVGGPGKATAEVLPAWRNPALGAFGGLLVGLGIVLVARKFDHRLREEDEVVDALGEPVLAVVPAGGRGRTSKGSAWGSGIQTLRTSVYFRHPGEDACLSIAVTSPQPQARVAEVTEALAEALAGAGARVLLVEADLHDSRRRSFLDGGRDRAGDGSQGLAAYLEDRVSMDEVIRHDERSGVDVIPSGSTSADPVDLLHVHAMGDLVRDAGGRYDFLLVSSPATSVGTDAAALAARCDGAVLVLRGRRTTADQLRASKALLDRVDATVLGAVILK